MPRIRPVSPAEAQGEARDLLDAVGAQLGMVPNLHRTLAASPAALRSYMGAGLALAEGSLGEPLREQIALTVAEAHGCEYCLAAHAALGRAAGLSEDQIADGRRGSSPDRRADAALTLARRLVETQGDVADVDLARARSSGLGDAEIVEIVANVALSTFANTLNLLARPDVDFPALKGRAAGAAPERPGSSTC